MSSGWSEWPAPAKLNLFLRIVGRRADGYHLLQTVFRLLDWGDTIRLRPRADGRILSRPRRRPRRSRGACGDSGLRTRRCVAAGTSW